MTLSETKQLLEILELAFPHTYKNMDKEKASKTIQFYHSFFHEYETPIVVQALRNYIKTNKAFPSIAGIQEQIDLLIGEKDTAAELWIALRKAVSRSSWHSGEEYEKLPEPVKIWVRDPEGLRELAMLGLDTFNTVTRGQFLKTIVEIKDRSEARENLPEEVRQAIDGLKLIGGQVCGK